MSATEVKKFRKKLPPVEAYQVQRELQEVETINGIMIARKGDWILRFSNGDKAVCNDEVFSKMYEAA